MASHNDDLRALVMAAKSKDERAVSLLVDRFWPELMAWASGRLGRSRDRYETADIVSLTMQSLLRNLDSFEYTSKSALWAYLMLGIRNRVRDEARRKVPQLIDIDERVHADDDGSSWEPVVRHYGSNQGLVDAYDDALSALDPSAQRVVTLRLEQGRPWADIAREVGLPTADAARMLFARSRRRLGRHLRRLCEERSLALDSVDVPGLATAKG